MLTILYQFTMFYGESYGASPHDLVLFIMTCNHNSQQCFARKATMFFSHD